MNSEVEMGLLRAKDCVLIEHRSGKYNIAGVNLVITCTKIYVPELTLSISDNIKLLGNIKQGFKRTFSWNKYVPEKTTQRKNNILDYMIDPTLRNINRLFVLSFKIIQKWGK